MRKSWGCVLASHLNTFVSHELIATTWEGRTLGENVVSVAVARLRKALAAREGRRIQNAYGRVYRFASALSSLPPPLAPDKSASVLRPAARARGGPPFVAMGREFALRALTQALEAPLGARGGLCALIGTGTISTCLATPVLDFGEAGEFSFYTRMPDSGAEYPDRLEVRLCSDGSCALPTGSANATTGYDTLLLSVNPNLERGLP